MADDNLKVIFYLTKDGWLPGTRTFFDNVQGKEIVKPKEAIATYELHIYQRSMYSKEQRSFSLLWKSKNITTKELNILFGKYPTPNEDTQW